MSDYASVEVVFIHNVTFNICSICEQ